MADTVKEKDIWVHSFRMPPDSNNSIKMEVGIEDCLHIEFEYNKSKCVIFPFTNPFSKLMSVRYHLKDVIVGKIYFLLVRIKIKHMELSIIRRETTGSPPNQYNESETITKFEIMDGAPVRGKALSATIPNISTKLILSKAKQFQSAFSLVALISRQHSGMSTRNSLPGII